MNLTPRLRDIISGLTALCLISAAVIIGVSSAFGAFDSVYTLRASFDTAGQGLIQGSDVKMRGVNIGKVAGVELVDGRALVTMHIEDGERIPTGVEAVVRPKTLFGEKFVDMSIPPGVIEGDGATFFATDDNARVPDNQTRGGFELEEVLADAYPLLQDLNPADIKTVISSLADAATGLGPIVNRQLVNGQKVLDVLADHNRDTEAFLGNLAVISRELGVRSDDLVAVATSLNDALPTFIANGDNLDTLLEQTARLSDDAADLLNSNKAFVDRVFNGGQETLNLLYERRGDIIPLVIGLRDYAQALVSIGRIPQGDGTMMGAVKLITGGQICAVLTCPNLPSGGTAAGATAAGPTVPPLPAATPPVTSNPLASVTTGVQAILDLLGGVLAR